MPNFHSTLLSGRAEGGGYAWRGGESSIPRLFANLNACVCICAQHTVLIDLLILHSETKSAIRRRQKDKKVT